MKYDPVGKSRIFMVFRVVDQAWNSDPSISWSVVYGWGQVIRRAQHVVPFWEIKLDSLLYTFLIGMLGELRHRSPGFWELKLLSYPGITPHFFTKRGVPCLKKVCVGGRGGIGHWDRHLHYTKLWKGIYLFVFLLLTPCSEKTCAVCWAKSEERKITDWLMKRTSQKNMKKQQVKSLSRKTSLWTLAWDGNKIPLPTFKMEETAITMKKHYMQTSKKAFTYHTTMCATSWSYCILSKRMWYITHAKIIILQIVVVVLFVFFFLRDPVVWLMKLIFVHTNYIMWHLSFWKVCNTAEIRINDVTFVLSDDLEKSLTPLK